MKGLRVIGAAAVLAASFLSSACASPEPKSAVREESPAKECSGYQAKCWWPDRKAIDAILGL